MSGTSSHGALIDSTIAASNIPHTPLANTFTSQWPQEERFQTISAQQEYADLSLEELRLADYQKSNGLLSGHADNHEAKAPNQLFQQKPQLSKNTGSNLELLTGPAITVKVGTTTSTTEGSVSWTLPQRLISHHSLFLNAACLNEFREHHENMIELAHDDPAIFALFVEWLYYGEYTIVPFQAPQPYTGPGRVSIDAECWVLGDKLLSTEFKGYAMRRLYNQHVTTMFSRPISTHDVQFASENSPETSRLRQFFVHLAATNIGNQNQVQGTLDEWDKILLSHSDLRRLLLEHVRSQPLEWRIIRSEEYYVQDEVAAP